MMYDQNELEKLFHGDDDVCCMIKMSLRSSSMVLSSELQSDMLDDVLMH